MTHLVQQWKDRLAEVQSELRGVTDETAAIQRQREQLQAERNSFSAACKSEKIKLQAEMKSLESRAASIDDRLAKAAARKAEADSIMSAASTEYSLDLVQLMNEVKAAEAALARREVPAEALERESMLWCTEEEQLRSRMQGVERVIVEQRHAATSAVARAEDEARRAESELHAVRMARDANEGLGPFVFADSVVAQFPDMLVPPCTHLDVETGGRHRKGRSASGALLNKPGSRTGSAAPKPLQQRPTNENVDAAAQEDAAPGS